MRPISLTERVLDRLFGRHQIRSEPIVSNRVTVAMPERDYPATVIITRHLVRRPRWPGLSVSFTTKIIPDTPIPRPGPYDDEDATESVLIGGYSVEGAIAELRDSVLKHRATSH